ncbi:transport-associated protein [Acidisarcina polymorpha]|uniref:Transport-associated protein n=2 Tax=Acidisarcina polymorpha TaxID=2211140 RepID=A0A2Z5FZ66_9BACT|nr:transport-associated protein [Acidisarcina polymorpha]
MLMKKISYSLLGYGTTAFNAISLNVRNRIVTVSGTADGSVDKPTAVTDAPIRHA